MQQAQQLNAPAFDSVHHNEGRPTNHQFTRALLAAGSPHLGMLQELVDLVLDAVALVDGGQRVVLGDVIELCVSVIERAFQPYQQ